MNCDKCGKPVPRENDATQVYAVAFDRPMALIFYKPRHFMPTADCEGSPSRAQYIEGQPRDERGYEYDPALEGPYRAAYLSLLSEAESTPLRELVPGKDA